MIKVLSVDKLMDKTDSYLGELFFPHREEVKDLVADVAQEQLIVALRQVVEILETLIRESASGLELALELAGTIIELKKQVEGK